jgi:site-specific DNA-methyltransferase (adenine-specific)
MRGGISVDDVTLWQGDCLDKMSNIADGSVDLILCDLPYGTTACAWDSVIPLQPLWAHYKRIIKSTGAIILTASQPFTTVLIASNMEWFKYCWVWEKTRATDFVNAKNKPMKRHEDIAVFSPGTTANGSDRRMTYNPQGLVYKREDYYRPNPKMKNGGVIGERPSHTNGYVREWTNYPTSILEFANPNNGSVHPTQKPVDLGEYLICTYTNQGETVLDNTMGSGSFGVAAINTGRRFMGIEREDKYFEIAKRRIAEAVAKKAEEASRPVVEQARLF